MKGPKSRVKNSFDLIKETYVKSLNEPIMK